jgi:CubicO group peptidase (beta-lactamase class C family)
LGVARFHRRAVQPTESVGDFYWGGATGTYFWVGPQEQLIAVMMLQVANDQRIHYRYLTRELVYQAIID